MAKPSIKDIVDELIELEPTLVEHRSALEKNIKAIVQAKPDTKFTQSFKKKLLKDLQTVIASSPTLTSSPLSETMNKWIYAIGGAAVASIGMYITVINPLVPMSTTPSDSEAINPMQEHMKMNNAVVQNMPMADGGYVEHEEDAMAMPVEHYQAEGGRAGGGGFGMADSRMMIAPGEPMPSYRSMQYVYEGDIELPESDTIEVFRRNRLNATSSNAQLLEGTFVADLMDVSQLTSLNITSISLTETGDEPLYVNVDFQEGTIGMHRQINYSNRPESNCRDQACFDRYRLKEHDMLSDDRAIAIANEFLIDLGVDTTKYGEPILQDDWRLRYDMATAAQKTSFYFPEQLSVTYPYLVNGMPVYDEWGNANGLSVNVDIRLRAATNMWGLRVMDYETDEMEAVSDPETVRQFMNLGNGYAPPEADTVTATLGEPRLVYISHYNWDEDTQEGYEVYLPALGFPVTDRPKDSYEFRKMVVVPLSQKILTERLEHMPPDAYPMPMPLEEMPDMPPSPMMKEEMMEGEAG